MKLSYQKRSNVHTSPAPPSPAVTQRQREGKGRERTVCVGSGKCLNTTPTFNPHFYTTTPTSNIILHSKPTIEVEKQVGPNS